VILNQKLPLSIIKKHLRGKEVLFPMSKDETKEKLIKAVGQVLETEGHTGLKVSKIAAKAGVDKALIYRYFGDVDNLIEIFLLREDFWAGTARDVNDAVSDLKDIKLQDLINFYLEKQYDAVSENKVLQKTMLWSISEKNPVMEKMIANREETGSSLFTLVDHVIEKRKVNFRAISAINVAATYYLAMHSAHNEGTFCELAIHTEEGKEEIKKAIRLINQWAFEKGSK